MAYAFIEHLKLCFPSAIIDVIIKQNLSELVKFYPNIRSVYSFNKNGYKGLMGLRRFAKKIDETYQIFFILPDSFSSAFMGGVIKAKHKVGYSNELRSIFLSHAYSIPNKIHRVDKYCKLLDKYIHSKETSIFSTVFKHIEPNNIDNLLPNSQKYIVLNLVSEDEKRTFGKDESLTIINAIQKILPTTKIAIIGTAKAQKHFNNLKIYLANTQNIVDLTQKTNLTELVSLLQSADLLISTDSGPAHLANSLATKVIVFFGKGKVWETSPYNKKDLEILDFYTVKEQTLIFAINRLIV